MKAIYKYPLGVNDTARLDMPKGADILALQVQRSLPCIWAMVDIPLPQIVRRRFRTFGTGHMIPDGFDGTYVGTYQLSGGDLVFHVFEVPETS